jgi:hypothetical protein
MTEINNTHQPKLNDVVAIHLTNGSTVLGRLVVNDMLYATLKKPMSLIVQGTGQQGQLSISMMPYLTLGVFPALDEIDFDTEMYILMRPVPKQLEDIYLENTSGIAIVR